MNTLLIDHFTFTSHRRLMTSRVQPVQHTIDTPYPVGPVHCYTLEWDGDLLLFDTGPPTEQAREYLRKNTDLSRLKHVLITHCHIDHYGLAHWLEEETGATIYLPYRDCLKIERHEERLEGMYRYLVSVGFSHNFVQELHATMSSGTIFPKLPQNHKVAEEYIGDTFGFDVIDCPGHSQSDLVYIVGDSAITGDTLLEGIFQSPLLDIDLKTGERFLNYEVYCTSLVKLATLARLCILPGHRHSVKSVRATLLAYIQKLLQRIEPLLSKKGEENIASLIEHLFPSKLTPFQKYLKASEIQFALDMFEQPERLKEALVQTGLFATVSKDYSRILGS